MSETVCGYEIHPACGILPMMPAAALAELAEDIRRHGQQQPVVLFEGKVLDGRNRLRACEIAGVEPEVREWQGDDPLRWVLSLNFHRRHLTTDQRAVVGARAERLLAERARRAEGLPAETAPAEPPPPEVEDAAPAPPPPPRPRTPSELSIERQARQAAAELVNVSAQRIARGRKLLDTAVPDLVAAVERGEVTVAQAGRVATLAAEAQAALVAEGAGAVVAEAQRIVQAQRAPRPSFPKALDDLDARCEAWTLSRAPDGVYVFAGTRDGEAAPVRGEGEDVKAAVFEAWAALDLREPSDG
jgi:hypothetical protein